MRTYPRLAADAGRIVQSRDAAAGELKLALFNAPEGFSTDPMMFLAASVPGPAWRRQLVEITHAGRTHVVRTPARKSVLGRATTMLRRGDSGSIEVLLHDPDQWLLSCTEQDLALGDNMAALGSEIIQFSEAIPLGGGRFRLAGLLRGQEGTKAAGHLPGEPFVLIETGTLEPINLPAWVPGEEVHASAAAGRAECSLMPVLKDRQSGRRKLRL